MSHYLLTGAGFSANWGGWVASEAFEYLLGTPEIMTDPQLRELLWKHQAAGGFEDALAELQGGYPSSHGQRWTDTQLIRFQGAVGRMFEDMNQGIINRSDLEFSRVDASHSVRSFLMNFDAIFTLNQDVLLEHFYCSDRVVQSGVRPEIPGMRKTAHAEAIHSESLSRASWQPRPPNEYRFSPECQQYIKLHGSANWYADDGRRVLILGGAKQKEIGNTPILQWYLQQFESKLMQSDARLMVIGYGFRDAHINSAIEKAVGHGLKIFVVDPRGAQIAYDMNQLRKGNRIGVADTALEQMLQRSVIGGSRRSLRVIFADDEIEHKKVMRFFSRP